MKEMAQETRAAFTPAPQHLISTTKTRITTPRGGRRGKLLSSRGEGSVQFEFLVLTSLDQLLFTVYTLFTR